MHDWAYLKLTDQEASDYNPQSSGVCTRGLLIRRCLLDGELAYFSTWAPQGTSLETLAQVEGRRWSIEQSFEAAKGLLGLNHNINPLVFAGNTARSHTLESEGH